MIKITWTMLESLIFQSMKPFYLVTTTSSWLHQRTLTRNQLLVHLKPSDMGWEEKHSYVLPPKKIQCKERRKDIQKQKKRKGQGFGDGPLLDSSWDNWNGRPTWAQDSNTGYGGSSSSSTRPWRPKITQDGFALSSFSVSWFVIAQNGTYSHSREIIPFLCTEFFSVMIYIYIYSLTER